MFETRCVKVRLKPGSLERVREWAETINRRKDEALATLRDETVVVESVFLDRVGGEDFLIYFMKAESFEQSVAAAQKSTHAIDVYHRSFMESVRVDGARLELLVDLDRITEL